MRLSFSLHSAHTLARVLIVARVTRGRNWHRATHRGSDATRRCDCVGGNGLGYGSEQETSRAMLKNMYSQTLTRHRQHQQHTTRTEPVPFVCVRMRPRHHTRCSRLCRFQSGPPMFSSCSPSFYNAPTAWNRMMFPRMRGAMVVGVG